MKNGGEDDNNNNGVSECVCVCERDHDDHGDDVMGGATASGKSSLNIK